MSWANEQINRLSRHVDALEDRATAAEARETRLLTLLASIAERRINCMPSADQSEYDVWKALASGVAEIEGDMP